MHLGTLLLRDGVIGLSELESGLRSQILYGGRLGTNLVECGALDLDTLGDYLATVHDTPVAAAARFERVDPAALALVPAELAEALGVFPIGFDDADQTILALAMTDPRDLDAVEALVDTTGLAISRYVAPELRIRYHLERHYGLTREARFVRMGTTATAPRHRGERRRMQPPRGLELPPALRVSPGNTMRGDASAPAEPDGASEGDPQPEPVRLDAIASGFDAAESREQVGDAIERFARGRLDVLALFTVRDGNALGWRCSRFSGDKESITRLSIPLGGASSLQAAHDTGQQFRGPPPAPGRPAEARLWAAIGIDEPPEEVVVIPVILGERVVNLLYAHARSSDTLADAADELAVLAEAMGETYLRLIRAAKRS
jgi:hypothetical protein